MKGNIFIFDKMATYSIKYDYAMYLWYRSSRLFFQSLIFKGRKLWAFQFFLNLKYELKKRELIEPFWLFLIGFMKLMPDILLFPRKLGGRIQGIPLPISERKQYTFTIKWLIKLIHDKQRVTITSLADSLISAIYEQGLAFEQKLAVYKISTDNRHLLKFLKKRKFFRRKRKKFRRVIKLERVTFKNGKQYTKKLMPRFFLKPRFKKRRHFKKNFRPYSGSRRKLR